MPQILDGSYGFENARKQRIVRPILAGVFEGSTEKNYVEISSRTKWVTFKGEVRPGVHGIPLIDEAIRHMQRLARKHRGPRIIPTAIYDLETVSNQTLSESITALNYAHEKGVKIYINAPNIERWLLLHLGAASINTSKQAIKTDLSRLIRECRLPVYNKPGSIHFFEELDIYKDRAIQTCTQHGHINYEGIALPCMCELLALLDNLEGYIPT